MAAPFIPLSLYPDFRMAMLNWLEVSERPFKLSVPDVYPSLPPREVSSTMELAMNASDQGAVVAFQCGDLSFRAKRETEWIRRDPSEGGFTARQQVAITCLGSALNRIITAAYGWEAEQKANGYEVDVVEDLGELMVGVVRKLVQILTLQKEPVGQFSPPCWSPRWDSYIQRAKKLGRVPTAVDLFTGAMYEYVNSALSNMRRGENPSYGFSTLYKEMQESFIAEAREDKLEAKAVAEDEQSQRTAYFRAVRAISAIKRERKEAQGGSKPRPQFPTRAERELKVMLPDIVQIADFSPTARRSRNEEEDL
jgi:hypothetical protein